MTTHELIAVMVMVVVAAAGVTYSVRLVLSRLNVIHDLVNSNLTRVTTDLRIAERRIGVLEAEIVSQHERGS